MSRLKIITTTLLTVLMGASVALGVGGTLTTDSHSSIASAAEKDLKGGEKIYLVPSSNWYEANARFACYFFNNSTGNKTWTDPQLVKINNLNHYLFEAPAGTWPNFILVRMNPASNINSWDNDWNQTADLRYDPDKPVHTISGWGGCTKSNFSTSFDSVTLGDSVVIQTGTDLSNSQGLWNQDGAVIAAYFFNDKGDNIWARGTMLEDKYQYVCTVPDARIYTAFKAVRLKPSTVSGWKSENNGLNWDNKWDETINFIPTNGKNRIKITGWDGDAFSTDKYHTAETLAHNMTAFSCNTNAYKTTAWGNFTTSFGALDDAQKNILYGNSSSNEKIIEALQRYDQIVSEDKDKAFITGRTVPSNAALFNGLIQGIALDDKNMFIIIISMLALLSIGAGTIYIYRRRKHN